MLQARNEKLALYQNATKQLELKKEKFEKMKGSPKAEKEIEEVCFRISLTKNGQAERRVTETQQEFNSISETCKSELQRFEEMKHRDLKRVLVKLTQINIDHGLQVVDGWKLLLSGLQDDDPSPDTTNT